MFKEAKKKQYCTDDRQLLQRDIIARDIHQYKMMNIGILLTEIGIKIFKARLLQ